MITLITLITLIALITLGIYELLPAVSTFMLGVLENDTIPTVDWSIDNTTGR